MSVTRRKFLLDCDAGTDDAQALFMALSQPDIDLVAITTVCGNTKVHNSAINCLRLLKFKNRLDIPVYKGSERSLLGGGSLSTGYHGEDGMGDVHIVGVDPVDPSLLQQEHAVTAIVRLVNEFPGELTIVVTGPLTNIALALHMDPELGKKLHGIFVMGGNLEGKGNITTNAEFNFYNDPEAVSFVLNYIGITVNIATMEVCQDAILWSWYKEFTQRPTKTCALVKDLERTKIEREKLRGMTEKCGMIFDQVAMAMAINTEFVTETRDVYATVELHGHCTRGQLAIDWRGILQKQPNVRLLLKLDHTLFEKLMYSVLDD